MKKQNFRYSALVELFGHRALAADDPEALQKESQAFHVRLQRVLAEIDTDEISSTVLLDKCILASNSAKVLVDIVSKLRIELLSIDAPLLLRGAIMPIAAEVKLHTKSGEANAHLPGIVLDRGSWQLVGYVEAFKGIGISLDDTLAESSGIASLANYYVADRGANVYRRFHDIPLKAKDLGYQQAVNLSRLLKEATHHSRKLSRFFVPFLMNWIENMDLSKVLPPDDEDLATIGLDQLIVQNRAFDNLGKIPGAELVVAKLIERLYPSPPPLGQSSRSRKKTDPGPIDPARRAMLENFVTRKNGWLQNVLRHDEDWERIPPEVAGRTARSQYRRRITHPGNPAGHRDRD